MIFFSYIIESPKFNKVEGIKMLETSRVAFHDLIEKLLRAKHVEQGEAVTSGMKVGDGPASWSHLSSLH